MAEAVALLGLISSIAQLVDFGSTVISRLADYQRTVSGTPKIFKALGTNLPLILDALKRIGAQAKSGSMNAETNRALVPVIVSCHAQIKSLDELLLKVLPLPAVGCLFVNCYRLFYNLAGQKLALTCQKTSACFGQVVG